MKYSDPKCEDDSNIVCPFVNDRCFGNIANLMGLLQTCGVVVYACELKCFCLVVITGCIVLLCTRVRALCFHFTTVRIRRSIPRSPGPRLNLFYYHIIFIMIYVTFNPIHP